MQPATSLGAIRDHVATGGERPRRFLDPSKRGLVQSEVRHPGSHTHVLHDRTPAVELRKTRLHARHRSSNARMVPYAGWEMPVDYSGIADEHMAVRTRAGVFDVSHMGEIEIAGKDALAAVQRVSSNDASLLKTGQAHYAALTTPAGTFVDDMLVYRLAPTHFMLVVNAANTAKDYAWISGQIKVAGDAAVSTRAVATP